jgi:hypothetical protein
MRTLQRISSSKFDYLRKNLVSLSFVIPYRLAVKEVGAEGYILSAVLRADERNKAVSERLGCDVFHCHLRVVYVPAVRKEIKRTKQAI